MKTTARKLLILGFAWFVSALMAHSEETAAATILEIAEPLFPPRAEMFGIFDGTITFLVDLDEKGTVTDFLPLWASSRFFREPVRDVIYDWRFEPARRDGVPVGSVMEIEMTFERRGVTVVSTSSTVNQIYLKTIAGGSERVNYVVPMSELDRLPTPIDAVRPLRYRNMTEEHMKGRVVFDFFIDSEGRVRMPLMVELEGDLLLAESAAIALEQWRFEPPLRRGRPVTARARQEFIIGR